MTTFRRHLTQLFALAALFGALTGAYHGNNSGNSVALVLPHSGLRVAIPLVTYKIAVSGEHPSGRGVVPEFESIPEIADYLSGKDVVLEQALRMARIK